MFFAGSSFESPFGPLFNLVLRPFPNNISTKIPTEGPKRGLERGSYFKEPPHELESGGGDPGGRCKWSPPVVARGLRSVHNLLLGHLRRQAKRIALLLGRCVFAMCFQNDI